MGTGPGVAAVLLIQTPSTHVPATWPQAISGAEPTRSLELLETLESRRSHSEEPRYHDMHKGMTLLVPTSQIGPLLGQHIFLCLELLSDWQQRAAQYRHQILCTLT